MKYSNLFFLVCKFWSGRASTVIISVNHQSEDVSALDFEEFKVASV